MRDLSLEEMTLVVGGRRGSGGSRSGSSRSRGDHGKGAGRGAKDGYSFDGQVEASKSRGNNPGLKDSLIGKAGKTIGNAFRGNGSPDYGSYNAMGDYTGGSSSRGDGDSGGRGHR